MAWNVEVNKDSLSEAGERVTTIVATYPRMIHSEIMTHRKIAKSSASSRAIPIQKMIAQVFRDPAGPIFWGKNQSGMQAATELSGLRRSVATWLFYKARFLMIVVAWLAWKVGLHKQIANRLLEPWMWITVIMTGTDWSNLFALRCHPAAQPEFQHLAKLLRKAFSESTPTRLLNGEWHLPFVTAEEVDNTRGWKVTPIVRDGVVCGFGGGVSNLLAKKENGASDPDWDHLCKLSVGRTCRVSYLTHDGKRDPAADVDLAGKVAGNGHFGALDHTCQAVAGHDGHGHLVGFKPYRKTLENESDFGVAAALEKVKAHPAMTGGNRVTGALWVGKRPSNRWALELLAGEPLSATRVGLGTGSLPDYYYVILAPLVSDLERLDVGFPSYGSSVKVFIVPVPGLDPASEPAIHTFTARTDFCGFRKVGGGS